MPPDLTIHTTYCCATNEHYEVRTVGSRGDVYTVTYRFGKYSCTCAAGQHGRPCKHIALEASNHCLWNSELEIVPLPDPRECPHCGAPLITVQVGA